MDKNITPIYNLIKYKSEVLSLDFFSDVISENASFNTTNMFRDRRLVFDYLIRGLCVWCDGNSRLAFADSYVNVTVGAKTVFRLPSLFLVADSVAYSYVDHNTVNSFLQPINILISRNDVFDVSINWPNKSPICSTRQIAVILKGNITKY